MAEKNHKTKTNQTYFEKDEQTTSSSISSSSSSYSPNSSHGLISLPFLFFFILLFL
jgi:hypothetical protein